LGPKQGRQKKTHGGDTEVALARERGKVSNLATADRITSEITPHNRGKGLEKVVNKGGKNNAETKREVRWIETERP